MNATINSDFKRTPYWWDGSPPWCPPVTPLPARCDVVIVGGGFSGLSTALELAKNGIAATVIEARHFGFNASGRNSGGVSLALDTTKIQRWHKMTGAARIPPVKDLVQGAADSVDHLERFIENHQVACDYHRRGRLSCAPTPAFYDELARRADRLNKVIDAGAYMVPRAEQKSEIGTDSFYGTMVVERSGQLNPARYHRALADLCLQAGVALHGETTVHSIDRTPGGFAIATSRGPITADRVVMATNAHSQALSADLGRRLVPVASHIIVTEELDEKVADALLPRRRTGADNRRLLAYFRRTPDGRRFLYGGRASPVELSEVKTAATLYRQMVERFPQLNGVRIGHAWGCRVAFTFDGIPHMGQRDGIYYLVGCNGNGVAMMSYLGYQVARKIVTGDASVCVFDQPHFPKPPLYEGKPWFLPAIASAYRTLDNIDRMRSG